MASPPGVARSSSLSESVLLLLKAQAPDALFAQVGEPDGPMADSRDAITKVGSRGAAVVPGDPENWHRPGLTEVCRTAYGRVCSTSEYGAFLPWP
jgi:hypothetical protein